MPEPVVEKPDIPPEYGNPTQRLDWTDVERRLESATMYWIASTRRDGRPHVIPRDGMWLDGGLHYGGSPETVHYRNITHNPHAVVHIGDESGGDHRRGRSRDREAHGGDGRASVR